MANQQEKCYVLSNGILPESCAQKSGGGINMAYIEWLGDTFGAPAWIT
jgi:hypothetical protein